MNMLSKTLNPYKMRKTAFILTLSFLLGQLVLTGCTTEAATETALIIDIKEIAGKSLAEVEQVLSKSEAQETVTGYPCKNIDCTRNHFQNGKYEIIFREGVANRITINNTPDLSSTESAITALGLPNSNATFANPNTVMRWNNVAGLDEVAFFTDYVLVQVTKAE